MSEHKGREHVAVGRYLARIREEAGLTQAQLVNKINSRGKSRQAPPSPAAFAGNFQVLRPKNPLVTLSTASISRIESGEKVVSSSELEAILQAIGSPKARQLRDFLEQTWDVLECPALDHPDRASLWEANLALRKLQELRAASRLKSVFLRQINLYEAELHRLAAFLRLREHQIAFIGCIGVGKTTAICKLTGLIKPAEARLELDRQIVLETGAGGITLCEVHISQGPKYGLRVTPRTLDSIRKDVEDFAYYLLKTYCPHAIVREPKNDEGGGPPERESTVLCPGTPSVVQGDENEDPLAVSKEVIRAIRNMSGLTRRRPAGGKGAWVDPAQELARQCANLQALTVEIFSRMGLERRCRADSWYPDDCEQTPAQWLQQLFSDVNNGRHPEFSLPQIIEVIIPGPVFASKELSIKVIDTKGVDQTAERPDLECHFDDPRTLVVLCTRFNDAPDLVTQTLLQRAKAANVRYIEPKTVVLALPHPGEVRKVKHDDGTRVENEQEGYDLKREQIEIPLRAKGLDGLSVEFLNAQDEAPEPVRDRLVAKIAEYRQHYCEQISRLSEAVDQLIENQKDTQVGLVLEEVSRRLSVWIDSHRELDWADLEVQKHLVNAINGTRYASTIRAAVNRNGNWTSLDYYHHLAYGSRLAAGSLIDGKVRDFKVIIDNLLADPDLAPAGNFLSRVKVRLDTHVDEAYRKVQIGGREAYKSALEKDWPFWRQCGERWGAGPGYRRAIGQMTEEQLRSSYEEARQLVRHFISDEWSKIISGLEEMLREEKVRTAAATA